MITESLLRMWTRPDAKRKLLLALVFVIAYASSVVSLVNEPESNSAWGALLALTIMGISALPFVKDFIWPSGLDNTAATALSLACHEWKNAYIFIVCPELGGNLSGYDGDDIWEKMLSASHHKDTPANRARFRPLFNEVAVHTQERIDWVLSRYSDVLPNHLRVLAHDAMTQLRLAPLSYSILGNPSDQGLFNQFHQLINALSKLDRPAHELQTKTKRN